MLTFSVGVLKVDIPKGSAGDPVVNGDAKGFVVLAGVPMGPTGVPDTRGGIAGGERMNALAGVLTLFTGSCKQRKLNFRC